MKLHIYNTKYIEPLHLWHHVLYDVNLRIFTNFFYNLMYLAHISGLYFITKHLNYNKKSEILLKIPTPGSLKLNIQPRGRKGYKKTTNFSLLLEVAYFENDGTCSTE